jgi:hypothetical protein
METTPETPFEPIARSGQVAPPARSGATRLTVAWSILLGVVFLSVGLTDLAAGLSSSSRRMIDVGGLVDARIAQTVTGSVITIVSVVHLTFTVGLWRLRPGARDGLLTTTSLWVVAASLVAVLQGTAGLGARTWLTIGVAVANLVLLGLLLQRDHREDLERADARRRGARI